MTQMIYNGSDKKEKLHNFRVAQLLSQLNDNIIAFLERELEIPIALTNVNYEQDITIPKGYSIDVIRIQPLQNTGTVRLIISNITSNENIIDINITGTGDVITYANYLPPDITTEYNIKLNTIPDTGTIYRLSLKMFIRKRM